MSASDDDFLRTSYDQLRHTIDTISQNDLVLPAAHLYDHATTAIQDLPTATQGIGREATLHHLLRDIVPALNGQNLSGRYYGFVTGSTLPVAEAADNIVTSLDQNVAVHLPGQSVSTAVEDITLQALLRLLRLDATSTAEKILWPGRIVTTGATASNVLGLACGREAIIRWRHPRALGPSELGLLTACREAGVQGIQILTSMGHSSLSKAASVVGLGSGSVQELSLSEAEPWRLDLDAVEREVQKDGVASIIVVSAGEVNTGRFATNGEDDLRRLRELADRYKAWIHIDGAFGLLARILPQNDECYAHQVTAVQGIELADSITGDAHKLFNVPYDAGFFFCRHLAIQTSVFQNPNAAYLTAPTCAIQSPLNIGLENSRRFRALPIYAVLRSEGEEGLRAMLCRMVEMARRVAGFIQAHAHYQLLPSGANSSSSSANKEDMQTELDHTWVVVIFRDSRSEYNTVLTERINKTRRMYVSGTSWAGQKATRIAVSSWRVNVEEDLAVVTEVLESLAQTAPVE